MFISKILFPRLSQIRNIPADMIGRVIVNFNIHAETVGNLPCRWILVEVGITGPRSMAPNRSDTHNAQ
jgi:hypothetical protein